MRASRRLEEALKMLLAMKEAGLKPDEARARETAKPKEDEEHEEKEMGVS